MSRQIMIRLAGVIALSALTLGARAAEPAAPLTEAAVVQIALEHSPILRMAEAEAAMAGARADMARAEGKLQVSANGLAAASSMRNIMPVPFVMPQALLQTQDRASVDLNVTAMVPLYTGGRIASTTRAATLTAEAARAETATARTQVAAEARMRFAEWQQAQAMVQIAQDTVTARTQAAQTTQQLFEAGKAPRFDVARAQAELAAAKQALANAEAEVAGARSRLAQTLGVPAESLGEPAEEALPTAPSDALATALATRPELRSAGQRIAAAEATLVARRAEYAPQVYAFGMADALIPSDMGQSTGLAVGVAAGVPLLGGGRRKAQIAEAQQGVTQAQAARDAAELQVRADVGSAEPRVTAARQNIDTATAQVQAADEAYTVAQVRYGAGKGTIVELLDAQRAQTEARQSLAIAQAQYRAALAELYRAMGLDLIAG